MIPINTTKKTPRNPSKICGKQPLKILKYMVCLSKSQRESVKKNISFNIPAIIVYAYAISSTSSDQDAQYITQRSRPTIFNHGLSRLEFLKTFVNDFKTLPFSTMYRFDETKEQLDTLNTLTQEYIERRAPLTKVKFTRPPVSWMKGLDITALKQKYIRQKFQTTFLSSNKNYNNDLSGIKTKQCQLKYQFTGVNLNRSFSITTKKVTKKLRKCQIN